MASGVRDFIGSDENELVRWVADSYEGAPPQYYPFVLYGHTGTGKSLLVHGLVARWRISHPESLVVLSSGVDFARSYADAVETDSVGDFRNRVTSADLLILDGLDELVGRQPAQQELSVMLDILADRGARVLLTARRLPSEIRDLSPRLISRLSSGLSIPVCSPGPAARRVLLAQLAEIQGVELCESVIDLMSDGLASQGSVSITASQLNRWVMLLAQRAREDDVPIDVSLARSVMTRDSGGPATLKTICAEVARCFGVKLSELRGPSRRQGIVRARGVAMYLARQLTNESLQNIGEHFGGRDHTTVLHACRKTEDVLATDAVLRQAVERTTSQLARVG